MPGQTKLTWKLFVAVAGAMVFLAGPAVAQSDAAAQLAELEPLVNKVRHADTRVRVDAFHRVWTLALSSGSSDVKLRALDLMSEPAGSASDHIRMPAVYAIAEIANSSPDGRVKQKALATLREPMRASQLPIRIAAIDAVNSIVRAGNRGELASAALALLGEQVRSGNNGVRIPAINAVMRTVEKCPDARACNEALDLLQSPLDSMAAIGGMEVRMMAVVAVERIGVEASEPGTKAKAMGLAQAAAGKSGWEPEAKKRAQDAATHIQNSMKR